MKTQINSRHPTWLAALFIALALLCLIVAPATTIADGSGGNPPPGELDPPDTIGNGNSITVDTMYLDQAAMSSTENQSEGTSQEITTVDLLLLAIGALL